MFLLLLLCAFLVGLVLQKQGARISTRTAPTQSISRNRQIGHLPNADGLKLAMPACHIPKLLLLHFLSRFCALPRVVTSMFISPSLACYFTLGHHASIYVYLYEHHLLSPLPLLLFPSSPPSIPFFTLPTIPPSPAVL